MYLFIFLFTTLLMLSFVLFIVHLIIILSHSLSSHTCKLCVFSCVLCIPFSLLCLSLYSPLFPVASSHLISFHTFPFFLSLLFDTILKQTSSPRLIPGLLRLDRDCERLEVRGHLGFHSALNKSESEPVKTGRNVTR